MTRATAILSVCVGVSIVAHTAGAATVGLVLARAPERAVVEEYAARISLGARAAQSGARQSAQQTAHAQMPETERVEERTPREPPIELPDDPLPVPEERALTDATGPRPPRRRPPPAVNPVVVPVSASASQAADANGNTGIDGSTEQRVAVRETGESRDQGAASLEAVFDAQVRRHLRRAKRYPLQARRRGVEGNVVAVFEIDRAGGLLAHRILTSSGQRVFDRAAMAQIARAAPYPSPPPEMDWSQRAYRVVIRFRLEDVDDGSAGARGRR